MGASAHITFVKIHSFYRKIHLFQSSTGTTEINPSTDYGRPPIPSIRFRACVEGLRLDSVSRTRKSLEILTVTHLRVGLWLSVSAFSQVVSVAVLVMNGYFVNPRSKC